METQWCGYLGRMVDLLFLVDCSHHTIQNILYPVFISGLLIRAGWYCQELAKCTAVV